MFKEVGKDIIKMNLIKKELGISLIIFNNLLQKKINGKKMS